MKKKLFAALTASLMLCGMLTAPVSAAETYKKGDVNMDGVVDVADAQIALDAYIRAITGLEPKLTPEQLEAASISKRTVKIALTDKSIPFDVGDALVILHYATAVAAHISVPDDIEVYYNEKTEFHWTEEDWEKVK